MLEELLVDAPPAEVWQALVDRGRRRRWWSYLELEAVVGAELVERWTAPDGQEVLTTGSVVDVRPGRLLRLTWSDESWPAETEVEISLTPAGGGTLVRVRHDGWERLPGGDRLAEEHRAGWRMHLSNLQRHLAGDQEAT